MELKILSTKQKALKINLDHLVYGSFAEIGAGQEVARQFFHAGGAAGTIAKSMSAYDMVVSDTIYGKEDNGRYVSETRLIKMLGREYDLVLSRLGATRDPKSRFFAFADTVAAKSFSGGSLCHGWLGLRFQDMPGAAPSEIIIHIKMFDKENIQQQKALGILGVNILFACFFYVTKGPKHFVESLMDELTTDRIEIATIKVAGPGFKDMDSRLLSLELVKRKFTAAIMFDSDGSVLEPADALYKKNILMCRGSFRPPTFVNLDMIECGQRAFQNSLKKEEKENLVVIAEMSMNKLLERGKVDNEDFLARVDLLLTLKQKVMISNNETFYKACEFLRNLTKNKIGIILGVHNLTDIFDLSKHEKEHRGGLLGALGALFAPGTQIFVYPSKEDHSIEGSSPLSIQTLKLPEKLHNLRDYLKENGFLKDLEDYNPKFFGIWSREVLAMINEGDPRWESMVPASIVAVIKEKRLFGLN